MEALNDGDRTLESYLLDIVNVWGVSQVCIRDVIIQGPMFECEMEKGKSESRYCKTGSCDVVFMTTGTSAPGSFTHAATDAAKTKLEPALGASP